MKRYYFVIILLTFSYYASATGKVPSIIPLPSKIIMKEGTFNITPKTLIVIDDQTNGLIEVAHVFIAKLNSLMGTASEVLTFEAGRKYTNVIIFETKAVLFDSLGEEGYIMDITTKQLIITAASSKGIFYGLQSLWQLFPANIINPKLISKSYILPCLTIVDKPRFPWRGMLLDCCRHFMPKEVVLKYIDALSFYKMNRLHWHLTEDQAWRIEIKQYPNLTAFGSKRIEEDSSEYKGFYSQEDIKEIVAYAAIRNISIVPEIEMPGHAVAAIASYPYLSCTQEQLTIEPKWGVFKDVYCAGNDSVFQFLENVLNEVMTLFPFEYIHIGGDEVPKYRWDNCPKCTTLRNTLGLDNSDQLQQYFINRINNFLKKSQKKIIGWDEILDGGNLSNVTIQSWRGMEGAVKAAKTGNDAIVSPTSHAYFDAGVQAISLAKAYSFEPLPSELSGDEKKHVLGGECNIWTERITPANIDNMVFPRLLAMAEVLWSPKEQRNYVGFKKRVDKHYDILKQMRINYGFEDVPVVFNIHYVENKGFNIKLSSGQQGIKLFFSIENMNNKEYKPYTVPLTINSSFTIKAKANYKSVADTTLYIRKLVLHKALNKGMTLANPYSPNYEAAGNYALIDGLKGTANYRDGLWQGFQKQNMEAVVDLKKIMQVQFISAGFLQSAPSWIFYPEWVEFSGSVDGVIYTQISKIENTITMKSENTQIHDVETTFTPVPFRYIKVVAKNVGVCPPWHNGAGGEAWVFADEIIVK